MVNNHAPMVNTIERASWQSPVAKNSSHLPICRYPWIGHDRRDAWSVGAEIAEENTEKMIPFSAGLRV